MKAPRRMLSRGLPIDQFRSGGRGPAPLRLPRRADFSDVLHANWYHPLQASPSHLASGPASLSPRPLIQAISIAACAVTRGTMLR